MLQIVVELLFKKDKQKNVKRCVGEMLFNY
jgi:hypothetical protein